MISEYIKGRDNNFNLIRVVFSLIVFFAHGFNIYTDSPLTDDLIIWLSFKVGFLALYAFFVFSGFMVTASILRSEDLIDFFVARFLRIFPGLFAVTFVATFLLGPLVSKLSFLEYITTLQTYSYLLVTSLTTDPDQFLPGVFMDHAAIGAVNRPIWTLRYELILYILTAFAFSIGLYKNRGLALLLGLVIFLAYLAKVFSLGIESQYGFIDHFARFIMCYTLGSLAWIFKDKVPLQLNILIILIVVSMLFYDTPVSELSMILVFSYAIFYLAYVPNGKIRKYNKIGDYSYGIYIIHWPVASMFLAFYPALKPLELIGATIIFTIPAAILSWHFVEKPCLGKKKKVSQKIKSLFYFARTKTNSPI